MRLDGLVELVTFVTAIGCGLVGGVFFAFSTSVMPALGRLPPAHGIAAMQAINVVILNPWFLGLFLGTAAASVAVVVASLAHGVDTRAAFAIAGAVLYLAGSIAVTMALNVPLNDALAAATAESAEAARLWSHYLSTWTAWNHVRAAASLAAAVALTMALRRGV